MGLESDKNKWIKYRALVLLEIPQIYGNTELKLDRAAHTHILCIVSYRETLVSWWQKILKRKSVRLRNLQDRYAFKL